MAPFLIQFMLYFPEDKREYIPSFITLAVFFITCQQVISRT